VHLLDCSHPFVVVVLSVLRFNNVQSGFRRWLFVPVSRYPSTANEQVNVTTALVLLDRPAKQCVVKKLARITSCYVYDERLCNAAIVVKLENLLEGNAQPKEAEEEASRKAA